MWSTLAQQYNSMHFTDVLTSRVDDLQVSICIIYYTSFLDITVSVLELAFIYVYTTEWMWILIILVLCSVVIFWIHVNIICMISKMLVRNDFGTLSWINIRVTNWYLATKSVSYHLFWFSKSTWMKFGIKWACMHCKNKMVVLTLFRAVSFSSAWVHSMCLEKI